MKKRISAVAAALLLALALCVPAMAVDGKMDYVIDSDDLFTLYEWEGLENQAAEISQHHGCGVYIQFVYDYNDYDYGSIYETAETLYYADDFGEGEGQDGILLLVSFDTLDYALYYYGDKAALAFDANAIARLEEAFLPLFGEEDWCGGFYAYLAACDESLTRAETVTPAQADTPVSPARRILTVVGISCLVSLLICLSLKGKMKTVHRKSEARRYTADGLQLTDQYDRYTHTTESVRRVESSGSSSGGSNSSGGSSGKI